MSETRQLPPTIGQPPPEIDPAFLAPALEDYEILGKFGEGRMGLVYRTREKSLQRFVVLKMIRAGLYASGQDLQRFQLEVEIGIFSATSTLGLEKEKARQAWKKALEWMPTKAEANDFRKMGLDRKLGMP